MPDLLLELFSEEIPARMQRQAAEDLKRLVTNALVERGLTYEGAAAYATPRRLALQVVGLPGRQPDVREERKGPRVGAPDGPGGTRRPSRPASNPAISRAPHAATAGLRCTPIHSSTAAVRVHAGSGDISPATSAAAKCSRRSIVSPTMRQLSGETRANAAGLRVLCEPGRVIAGNAGVLLTRVIGLKSNGDKHFVLVDAAMNDLLRPALYGAWHTIEPVHASGRPTRVVDVVGPVCESGDFLAKARELPEVAPGELLAVRGAGAYGFSMASTYNSRPRAAEVLVDGDRWQVVRARELESDLWRGEHLLSQA